MCTKASVIQQHWNRYKHRCGLRRRERMAEAARTIQQAWRKYTQHRQQAAVIVLQKSKHLMRCHMLRNKFTIVVYAVLQHLCGIKYFWVKVYVSFIKKKKQQMNKPKLVLMPLHQIIEAMLSCVCVCVCAYILVHTF